MPKIRWNVGRVFRRGGRAIISFYRTVLWTLMAVIGDIALNIPEAKPYADLHGILGDVEAALGFAIMLRDPPWPPAIAAALNEPLTIALTVKYCRAFVTGVRERLKEEDTSFLPAHLRAAHEFTLSFRNKHVAHSVNAFEENIPRAHFIKEKMHEQGITDVSCLHVRTTGLSPAQLRDLIDLCEIWRDHLRERIQVEHSRLLAIVRRIPIEEILKEPAPRIPGFLRDPGSRR